MIKNNLSSRVQGIEASKTGVFFNLVANLKAQGADIISLNVGEPDFAPADRIVEVTNQALTDGHHRYSSNAGLPALKDAIIHKLEGLNQIMGITHEHLLVSNGSKQVIFSVFQSLLNEGDEVIILRPYWVTFPESIRLAGGVPVYIDSVNLQPDIEAIKQVITSKTKAIVINSPNNPSGAICPQDVMEELIQLAHQHHFYIISDEAYETLVYDGLQHISPAALPGGLECSLSIFTFSKTYAMTGFRVGYLLADPSFIKGVNRLQSHLTGNVCTFVQHGAIAALKSKQSFYDHLRTTFSKRRELAYQLCSELFPCIKPQGAFYLFPNVEAYLSDKIDSCEALAYHLLEEAGVAVVPGAAFGMPGHMRISYANDEVNIREGFSRIQKAIQHLK